MKKFFSLILLCVTCHLDAQDIFLEEFGPYIDQVPSPATFLGYEIGDHHTRYDRIVSYFEKLAAVSDRASFQVYGRTYGHRDLIMLTVTSAQNHQSLDQIQANHLRRNDPSVSTWADSDPVIIQLGYGVHGNESSSAEAAMLTAYILVASEHPDVIRYLNEAVVFIDPVINPDGRDRHTHWVNMHKGNVLVKDPIDIEHNEGWPRGRTNHYWFDLNRDWWLAIHPESRSKLGWYHQWYPNVVTDFHEMGTNSTYFFEPMKPNGSKNPIMPKDNYTTLNDTFARYYAEGLDEIGSLYFTKEVFDGTYPGYGSSYPDLQGGLGILFEQASSRGHVQKSATGDLTFAFTIRNQLVTSMATVKASVEHKAMLLDYQSRFFESALSNAASDPVKAYIFRETSDQHRLNAFLDKLLIHQVEVFELNEDVAIDGIGFKAGSAYVVPTDQVQYRMVQSTFETYDTYNDSVFYDASAWSLANTYNVEYKGVKRPVSTGTQVNRDGLSRNVPEVQSSRYAYLISWKDYQVPALLYQLLKDEVVVYSAFKPFEVSANGTTRAFDYGSLMIPVQQEKVSAERLLELLRRCSQQYHIEVTPIATGLNAAGVDLGSRYLRPVPIPKAMMLVGDGVAGYEAGEVWHLLDQRIHMPITKVETRMINRLKWDEYNVMVMVSGNYQMLDSSFVENLKDWISQGNTLITIREGTEWAIKNKVVTEELLDSDKEKSDSQQAEVKRLPYVDAPEHYGKTRVGGAIFSVDLDLTHPVAFGYEKVRLPVYRNSNVWLKPSSNPYSTVAAYSSDPHVDGYISKENLEEKLKKSASVIVSKSGQGRVVLFADNPNFRGTWYGTNRLFLNALFLGPHIGVPRVAD